MSIQHKNFRISDLKYDVNQEMIERILDLHKKFNQKFNQEDQEKLTYSQKIDYIYNTTALEGNTYTYAETETLLSGVTVGGHTLRESNEILNQQDAWRLTLESAFTQPKIEITEKLIKDIHFQAAKDFVIKPGEYRDGRVGIGGTDYTPPKTQQEITEVMRNFIVDFYNLKQDTFIKAIIIKFVIALIQPSFDGNKRTGRLMLNFVLLQNNYPLLSVPVKIRKNYVDAMLKGYETLDINDLIELLSNLMIKIFENYNISK